MANNNPLVAQGTLNRLRASVLLADAPELDVTASYLGADGIRIALDGDAVARLRSLTGTVPSPEPYINGSVSFALLKSQPLANFYKNRMESNSLVGTITIRPDATPLDPYVFQNCSIKGVGELRLNGTDPAYLVTLEGIYYVNSSLFDL